MSDSEKIRLLKQMIDDFFGFSTNEDECYRAVVFIEVISTVLEFGGDDNAAD